MHTPGFSSRFLSLVILFLLVSAATSVRAQEHASAGGHPKGMRFKVVHAHFGNNCAGYLYVTQDSVRYEALVPENYKSHSFEIPRDQISVVQPWVLMGKPQNITEIKTARATYHFWLLPKDADLNSARTSNLSAVAVPAAALILAIRDPQGVMEVGNKASDQGGETASARSENPETGAASPAAHSRSSSHPAEHGDADSPADSNSALVSASRSARTLPPGALEGIYVGFTLEYSRQGIHQYYFTPDGWVINNIPQVNMDNFNMTAYRNDPSNKLFFGRYRVDGKQIHIVWANNADRRNVIKFDESAASPGIDTYVPTCRCTGKRFSGRYHWASPTDQRFIQFSPDGTFLDHGLTDQVVFPNPHGFAGITDPPRNFRGTYSVRNQTLTFNFADGKQATVAFIVPQALEKAPKFDWMGLGHGSGVPGAETVVVLMLYEENYQVQP